MKKKPVILLAITLALVLSGGIYAYTFSTATGTIGIAEPTGNVATVNTSATQPNWNSILTPVPPGTETLRPNDAGDETGISSQFPTSGAHWDKVDEAASDGDTTYVARNSGGWLEDLYNVANHYSGSGSINYVRVYMVARATGTPNQASARIHIKTNGTEYDGSQVTVTTSYTAYSFQWDTNPQTDLAWTWSEIDALQIGVRIREANNNIPTRVTQVYVEVNYSGGGILLQGNVPTGDLFEVTVDNNYAGDLTVRVYLVNTGNLTKAYTYLNLELYLEDSEEAGETPNYRMLTLQNGVASFSMQGPVPGNHTVSVAGGSYGLVTDDTSQWSTGWTVAPQLYCEAVQR
ncbi:MAG: hypothetical protein HY665_01355 [Chloroflexi bacterium]|nr:hypothetical protein [Chloroflexota bacterium]